MDNFNLCICPKCNDTKKTRLVSIKISNPGINHYICEKCEIEWEVKLAWRRTSYGEYATALNVKII